MDTKAFPCFACDKSFDDAKALVCHVKSIHNSLDQLSYECKFKDCIGRSYSSCRSYSAHVTKHQSYPSNNSKRLKLSSQSHTEEIFETCNARILDNDIDNSDLHSEEGDVNSLSYVDKTVVFFNSVSNAVTKTAANLYSIDTLTRSHVQEIIDKMKDLFSDTYLGILEDTVIQALEKVNSPETGEIKVLFSILHGMFDDVATEHKRLNHFTELDAYIKPDQYPVGNTNSHKNVKGQVVLEPVILTGTLISPRKILKSFLELPGVLDKIVEYMDSLSAESNVMENFVQGTLWKDTIKPKFGDKLVLPLNLSFDDVETNKDLGSHTIVHKLSACHITIASLPPMYQSMLENIFLVLLFHSTDKHFGLEEVFRPLIDDLKFLESCGIEILVNNEIKKVYFALGLLSGDNLGLNTILGLVEGFTANYFCRICKLHREVTEYQLTEREDFLRTPANHNRDVQKADPTATGVKGPCIWNELSSYHFTENLYADIMHDISHGIGVYDMVFIIDHLVRKKKYLSYDELNDLIQGFYLGIEFGNKPPIISAEKIKEGTLGLSASETLCLIRYFSLMVGHKVTDKEDPVWLFYLDLRKLVDILFAPTFARSDLPLLDEMIAEHHKQYMKLTGKNLPPKFHLTTHYSRILKKIGPLKPVWTMRSEAKYKELRQAARATSCRIKIDYTLSVKSSLKMCTRFITKRGLIPKFEFSPYCEHVPVKEMKDFVNFSHKLPDQDSLYVVDWVNCGGTLYKPGMVVVFGLGCLYPEYGVINTICISENMEANFLLKRLNTLRWDAHLYSYEVENDPSWDSWIYVKQSALVCHTPSDLRVAFDGRRYVMQRYSL